MMKDLPVYLASRLPLRSRTRGGTTGVVVAVTGIALSVIVMLISISVMHGFRNEIRSKIIGFDSQITVAPRPTQYDTEAPTLTLAEMEDVISSLPDGATATLTARQPAIVKTPDNFSGVIVKGVDTGYDWSFIRSNLVEGTVPDFSADSTLYDIVLSRTLADNLGLSLGDKVDTYFLGNSTYRTRRLKIAGIYDTHFAEYDKNVVFATLPMIRRVGNIDPSRGALLEINGLGSDDDISFHAGQISAMLMDRIYTGDNDRSYIVVDIMESAALYFNWLALLDTNVAVILTLMAILASLTLVSSLFILVLRRVGTIGILKALGASNRLVRQTFVLLTLKLLAIGLAAGNAVALGLILIQKTTGIVPLDPEAYYLDHVPVEISWTSVAILNGATALIAFCVLLLPSAIIATIKPARVINYE